jgi:endonuclease/exonuclease/phosphatase family metal-dependent hydrolase
MSDILQERRPTMATARPQPTAEPDTELLSPATQIVGDKDTYLGNASSDIGRRIADDQLEMFVVCHPAEAMLQQFAQAAPDFIAIHDIGTQSSARLLSAVANASSQKLQKLVIRRQGYGVALATLQFVELPLRQGRNLRVYTTHIDADTQTRHQLAQVLLAHSRLAVVMLGELPPHALGSSLQPLREAIAAGAWPNRHMLLVPLAAAATLPAQAATLAGTSGVLVRTTPQVARPVDAWAFISGTWNRLNHNPAEVPQPKPSAAPLPRPAARPVVDMPAFAAPPVAAAYAPTQPLELSPMPSTGAHNAAPQSASSSALWNDYVRRCAAIKGVTECCVFDIDIQRSLAHSGTQRMADRLAAKGAMMHAVISDSANVLGLGAAQADTAVTLEQHVLLLRPMPGRPRVALHLVIDRHHGNLALARAQLQQIDQSLLGTAP